MILLLSSNLFAAGSERKILFKFERLNEKISTTDMFQICPKVGDAGKIQIMKEVLFTKNKLSEREFKEKICKKPDYGYRLNTPKTVYTEIQCTGGAEYFYLKADCIFTGNPLRSLKVTPNKIKLKHGEVLRISYEGGDPDSVFICLAPSSDQVLECLPDFRVSAPNPIGVTYIDTNAIIKPEEKTKKFELRIYGGPEKTSPFIRYENLIEIYQPTKKK